MDSEDERDPEWLREKTTMVRIFFTEKTAQESFDVQLYHNNHSGALFFNRFSVTDLLLHNLSAPPANQGTALGPRLTLDGY